MQKNYQQLSIAILAGVLCSVSLAANALSPAAQVGKLMFFDTSLSSSGKMACATCHDPQNHYAPSNSLSVQLGGPNLTTSGTRAVPTLTYKDYTPPYADLADNPDGVSTNGPGGGFTQDGHANTLADQAQIPLLAPNEMNNSSIADVVNKIQHSTYVNQFLLAFGSDAFNHMDTAFADAMQALQSFQLEDDSFHPYTSKYDLYSGNKIGGALTASEARGLAVFNDVNKGNCAACHFSGAGFNGSVGLFTDFSYAAIGAPRNSTIPANVTMRGLPLSYDLGICGRKDHPLPASAQYCGMFKVPTLRNVATRKAFFHNGQIKSLAQVINFYNTRDTNPAAWYPSINGVVQKFNDLPTIYRGNIDKQAPLDGRPVGSQPAMTNQDMLDLEAFLGTLTDGYKPQ